MPCPRSLCLAAAMCAAVLLRAAPAAGKATFDSAYNYDQTFGTALRLLKVDLELEVTETNADWGYLLFVYTNRETGQRKNRGSFSFVRVGDSVQVTLQLPELPSYHEQHIVKQLQKKLEVEHGMPPPAPKKKPAAKREAKDKEKDKDKAERPKSDDDKSDDERPRARKRGRSSQ